MIDVQNYLKEFYKGSRKPSLKAMKYFMNIYDNFEKNMKFIHIAGTNGKGSCTEMLSNILVKNGFKVGKFISPHLIRYNERICINGNEITDKEMAQLIEELIPLIKTYNELEKVNITLFELETIMALLYFYRNKVDFVILETGLGGQYDCTNIITNPIVSIITSIGYDHMHILGNTLPKIAFEKAGIIKEKSDTVIFEQIPNVDKIFIDKCSELHNSLHIIKETDISNYKFDDKYQYFDFKNMGPFTINLKGKIQVKNACLCIETINILTKSGYKISKENIRQGLKTVIHKGRMEEINHKPLIIYDGAHNEPAIKNLQKMIYMYYKNYKRLYIISILKTKDYKKMLQILSKDNEAFFILTSGNDEDRYVSKSELYECMKKHVKKDRIQMKDIKVAILDAMNSDNNTVNFVVGSFYTYGTVLEIIKNNSTN